MSTKKDEIVVTLENFLSIFRNLNAIKNILIADTVEIRMLSKKVFSPPLSVCFTLQNKHLKNT